TFDRAITASPQSFGARALKAGVAILSRGDVTFAENQLASIPPGFDSDGLVTWARVWLLTLQRKFSNALEVVGQFRGEILASDTTAPNPKPFLEGLLYYYQGDKTKAQTALEHARVMVEQLIRESPDDAARHAMLGQILAALGQKDSAIAEGKRAAELQPESQDAFDGPQISARLAEIYVWVGEYDQAFRLLDHLL